MAKRPAARGTSRTPAVRKSARPDALTDDHRIMIVTRLAMFDRVSAIHADLQADGVDVSHQAVSAYNPDNNPNLSERWRQLFLETRQKWMAEVAAEPIAHRAYRLRRLGELHENAIDRALAATDPAEIVELSREARAALEQAAKEVGNVFSNVSKSVGVVAHRHEVVHTIEEKRNMLADRLGEAMRRAAASRQIVEG